MEPSTQPPHALSVLQACEQLQTDAEAGLSAQEVVSRAQQFGPNLLVYTCASRRGPLHRTMRGNFVVTIPEGR